MIIQAIKGQDVLIDADTHVIIRIQGRQWRISAPDSGTAVWPGRWSLNLEYYGGKAISGDVWIGKEHHTITIQPRG